ncbi:glycosyltransferase [Proteiniclasticum sp.]|uniref:glycosyltransferase n=1 Tax=Proteiniclasticum sp. TaxID=2053595 RepID=UPI0028969EDD|nr:glycosyltransferase [Proteiniclasticum sp.]
MKVLILGFTKISYMPYMHFYVEQLKKNNCDIHLMYWKRDQTPDSQCPDGIKSYVLDQYQEDSVPLIYKLGNFYKYRNQVLKILKNQNFDFIIALHSTPGVLMSDILTSKFKGRYIVDYRDFTYENHAYYKRIIHKLVENSAATFVSSDAFRQYLPNRDNIFTSHNILTDSLEYRDIRRILPRESEPIRIRYWGLIRHEDINLKIIKKIGNDQRFELHYHGRSQKTGRLLQEYCKENKLTNVFFHGEYKPLDRYKFIDKTDLLHNIFDNDKTMKPAMSNKYYDGILFYIPQICNEGSFMGEQVKNNCVGIALNPYSPNFADEIYNYYHDIDWISFNNSCDKTLDNIINQYNDGINVIEKIIHRKKEKVNV